MEMQSLHHHSIYIAKNRNTAGAFGNVTSAVRHFFTGHVIVCSPAPVRSTDTDSRVVSARFFISKASRLLFDMVFQ